MKKKVLSMLMAAMMVSNCGIVAFAEEVEEVVVEASVEEAAPAEAVTEETAPVEVEAVEIEEAVEVTDEAVEIADEEVALTGPEAEVEIEVESDEDTEVDEEITIEDEEVALAATEEEHEHHFAYRSNGDQTHTKFCTDCDDEKEIVNCVDEDEDGVCDICNGDLGVVMASQLKVEVHHFNNFVVTFDDVEYELEEGSYLEYDETNFSDSIRGSFGELVAASGVQDAESESELFYRSRIDYSIFENLEGIEDVYAELSGEIPSNASIVIYEKDGVIEDYTIEMNDNYDFDKSYETVEEERTTIEDEETPLAGGDQESEDDKDEESVDSDDVVAKISDIDIPEVVVEAEEAADDDNEVIDEAPVNNETVEVSEVVAAEEVTDVSVDAE